MVDRLKRERGRITDRLGRERERERGRIVDKVKREEGQLTG